VLLGDFDRIANVIPVAMCAQQNVNLGDVLIRRGAHRIAHDPGIDDDCFSAGSLNPESCMTQPSEFDSFQIHLYSLLLAYQVAKFGFPSETDFNRP
jgi:hypothetical protein